MSGIAPSTDDLTYYLVNSLKVGTVEDAKKAIDVGVDAIIVQGREAGGHVIGQVWCLGAPKLKYVFYSV